MGLPSVGVALDFSSFGRNCYNIPLAGLLQKHVGLRDSSSEYQKAFVCWRKMCLMVVSLKRTFYGNDGLSTTCQCRQLKLNPLSTQINIYCLMTNQTPALLVQRAPWTQATVMLLQSLYFSRPPPPTAIIPDARPPRYIWKSRGPRPSHEKIGDCEQSRDVITNVISANQHFASSFPMPDIQISETYLQALFPFPAPPPERPGELARGLLPNRRSSTVSFEMYPFS